MICAVAGWADDVVSAKYNGAKLDVELTNTTTFIAFQMDITLPEGVSVESITNNLGRLEQGTDVTIDATDYETPFVVQYNVVDPVNNVVRVIAYNLGNHEIKGASGKLFTLNLDGAITEATITNAKFVDTALIEKAIADAIAAKGGVLGDVTGEGDVDVTDVGIVLNVSLGIDPYDATCDFTGEGDVDVTDLGIVLNISLGVE